jgi:hypothetical protein
LAAVISGKGDYSAQPRIQGMRFGTHAWLAAVDVLAAQDAASIVVVSDNSNFVVSPYSWTARLVQRLRLNAATEHVSVVSEGDYEYFGFTDVGRGVHVLQRLEGDLLAKSGVKWLIISPFVPEINNTIGGMSVTSTDLRSVFFQIADRSHAAGVKVIACTIPPQSMTYGENRRQELNAWIRTSDAFDGVIDTDAAMRDPKVPAHSTMRDG